MAIRISVEVDENRLGGAGLSTDTDDILAELDAMREGRLACRPAITGCRSET